MAIYEYQVLNNKGEPTGEIVELLQKMSDEPYTKHPEDGRPVKRIISNLGVINDSKLAWEKHSDVRDHIRKTRPKWINDKEKGVRIRFDPKKHG